MIGESLFAQAKRLRIQAQASSEPDFEAAADIGFSPGAAPPPKEEPKRKSIFAAVKSGEMTPEQTVEAYRPPTIGEDIQKTGVRLGQTFTGGLAAGLKFGDRVIQRVLTGNDFYQEDANAFGSLAGQTQETNRNAEALIPPATQNQSHLGKFLTDTAPSAVGSFASAMVTGGTPVALAATFAAQGAEHEYENAEAKGAPAPVRWAAAALGGGIAAAQAIPLGRALTPVEGLVGKAKLLSILKDIANPNPAIGMAANNALATVIQNGVARGLYDKDRDLAQGVLEALEAGAFLQGAVHGVQAMGEPRGSARNDAVSTPVESAVQSPPPAAPAQTELPSVQAVPDQTIPGPQATDTGPPPGYVELARKDPDMVMRAILGQEPAVVLQHEASKLGEIGTGEPLSEAGRAMETVLGEQAKPAKVDKVEPKPVEEPAPIAEEPKAEPTPAKEAPATPSPGGADEGGGGASYTTEEATGIKRRTIEAKLKELDLPPPDKSDTRPDEEVYGQAMERFQADERVGEKLLNEINDSGRVPSDDDYATLTIEANRRYNELDALSEKYNADPTDANDAAVERARAGITEFANLTAKAKTESGRGLRMIQMMLGRDYSRLAMETAAIKANAGEPLSRAESAKIAEQAAKIKELMERDSTRSMRLDKLEADVQALAATTRLRREARSRQGRAERIVKTDTDIQAAWSDLKKFVTSKSAHDVVVLTAEATARLSKLAALYVKKGAQHLDLFVRDAVEHLGEAAREHALAAWKKATLEGHVVTAKERAASGGNPNRYVRKIAEHFVEQGIHERDALLDAVHAELPSMTRRQVQDAISGYGKFRQLSKDENAVKLRELGGEMQQVSKLEDLEKRLAPLKTGVERREPSAIERRLQKQVNDLRKKLGIVASRDPARELKSALESTKTRLRNQIDDLTDQISLGKKRESVKGAPVSDAEVAALTKTRDALKERFDEIFAEPKKPAQEAALERQIEALDEKIKKGDIAPRGAKQGPDTARVAELKAQRDKLNETLAEMRKAEKPAPKSAAKNTPKTAEQLRQEQVQRQIDGISKRIEAGDIAPKSGKATVDTEALAALKAKRGELSKQLADLRDAAKPEKPRADEERLKKSIALLEHRLETGDLSPRPAKQGPDTEAVATLKSKRDAAQAEVDWLRKIQNPKATPEERSLAAAKARMARQKDKLLEQRLYQDYGPRTKKEPVQLDKEGLDIKTDLARVQREVARDRAAFEQRNRTRKQVILDTTKEIVIDLPRSMRTMWDMSAVFRQGGFFSLGHPVDTARNQVPDMFRGAFEGEVGIEVGKVRAKVRIEALGGKDEALRIDTAIRNHPLFELSQRAKLEITSLDGTIGPQEEAIKSKFADRIWGKKLSDRGFVTFLNSQRMARFIDMMKSVPGGASLEDAKALAYFINIGTGRGVPGKLAGAASAASYVLWSPQLLLSRFKLLAGAPLFKATPRTRMLIAKEYARSLTGLGAFYVIASMGLSLIDDDDDPKIEHNPLSSDFGKVRIGDTRIDPLAGLAQVTVLLSRVPLGKTKTGSGKIVDITSGKFGVDDPSDVMWNFLRSKFTPAIGTAIELMNRRTFDHKPLTALGLAQENFVPLALQDVFKVMKEQGVAEGTAISLLSIFGMGVQNYHVKGQR